MSMTILPEPTVIDGVPPGVEGFPGAEMLSAYAYDGYFNLTDFDDVNTQRMDWATFQELDQDQIHNLLRQTEQSVYANGEEILAYVLYKGTDVVLGIPDQVCLFGVCWTPPFAGSSLITATHYRLWTMTRPVYGAMDNQLRIAVAPLLVIVIAGSIIAGILTIIGIEQLAQGRIKFSDLRATVQDILGAPGENIAKPIGAAFWPLAALGISMIAGAIVFPIAMSKVSLEAPIGPARVGGEISGGTAVSAPARGGGRRR